MKTTQLTRRTLLPALACALAGCATQGYASLQATRTQIEARTSALLTAYAANDQPAVLRMVDGDNLSIYGSDLSEHATSKPQLQQMMRDDFELWHTARFGSPHALDIRIGRDLATTLFDVPFSAGGTPEIELRMFVAWRKVGGEWLVTQGATSIPTVGASARELSRRH